MWLANILESTTLEHVVLLVVALNMFVAIYAAEWGMMHPSVDMPE